MDLFSAAIGAACVLFNNCEVDWQDFYDNVATVKGDGVLITLTNQKLATMTPNDPKFAIDCNVCITLNECKFNMRHTADSIQDFISKMRKVHGVCTSIR